ncbi:unnamed protein product [Bursaphelenchus okinawaensis]|uniref:Uncharacterized protein n=1 Tax=Bursaphelenchus okinawaensis TaxID=465554 RepID=A0A811LN95_9BILA|nr:unnamed protein product [Bursaphelenchus okinawaensis]CAG9126031.1 unnamed protein product [Bursaphelenchus okinawaensis]
MIPKPPDWTVWGLALLLLNSAIASPVKRQVTLDDLIHTALSFVKPIFDTSRPLQESPGVVKKNAYQGREVAVLGAPTLLQSSDSPICRGNSQICKFISCTAHNFKYDESFANLNLAAQLVQDPKMRKVISQNPEAVTSVCREQGLSHEQCRIFSKGFQLIDRFMNTIEKPVEEPTTEEPLEPMLEPINDSPEPYPSPPSLPAGSHTWSTRVKSIDTRSMPIGRDPPANRTMMKSTIHKTPSLGAMTVAPRKGNRAPHARNPRPTKYSTAQTTRRPVIARPPKPQIEEEYEEYEDDDLLQKRNLKIGVDDSPTNSYLMLISKLLLLSTGLLFVSAVPNLSSTPEEQLSQKPSLNDARPNEALSFISRFMQNGGIMNMVSKMLNLADQKQQADQVKKEMEEPPQSAFSIDSSPSQIDDSKQWKSVLLGPRGLLTEIFNQVKDKMQNQYNEDMHKINTKVQQEQQQDMSPEQLNFAKVFETFMQKAGKGNFDEPLPELPFIGICNRLNCGDIYKAVDEFRKSDFFSNFQTAMSLIHDPKGWDIIGKVLENPELIEDFTKHKVDTTDIKTDELSGFGTDFSPSIDGTAEHVGKELPQISSNLDYYSAVEKVKPEDEDYVDVEEKHKSETKSMANGAQKTEFASKMFKEEPLPMISENIDEYEVHVDKEETIKLDKEETVVNKNMKVDKEDTIGLEEKISNENLIPNTIQTTTTQTSTTVKLQQTTPKPPAPPVEPVKMVPSRNFRRNDDYYAMYYDA